MPMQRDYESLVVCPDGEIGAVVRVVPPLHPPNGEEEFLVGGPRDRRRVTVLKLDGREHTYEAWQLRGHHP